MAEPRNVKIVRGIIGGVEIQYLDKERIEKLFTAYKQFQPLLENNVTKNKAYSDEEKKEFLNAIKYFQKKLEKYHHEYGHLSKEEYLALKNLSNSAREALADDKLNAKMDARISGLKQEHKWESHGSERIFKDAFKAGYNLAIKKVQTFAEGKTLDVKQYSKDASALAEETLGQQQRLFFKGSFKQGFIEGFLCGIESAYNQQVLANKEHSEKKKITK